MGVGLGLVMLSLPWVMYCSAVQWLHVREGKSINREDGATETLRGVDSVYCACHFPADILTS